MIFPIASQITLTNRSAEQVEKVLSWQPRLQSQISSKGPDLQEQTVRALGVPSHCYSLSTPEPHTNMERANLSQDVEFEFLGLTSDPQLQKLLSVVFLAMYVITVLGNLTMFFLIPVSITLHTPIS